jgi:hypothetical protein
MSGLVSMAWLDDNVMKILGIFGDCFLGKIEVEMSLAVIGLFVWEIMKFFGRVC